MSLLWIYLALVAAGGLVIAAAAWCNHRDRRRPPLPQRTPDDVYRDVNQCRARHIDEVNQRLGQWHIDDNELADQLAIWTNEQAGLDRLRDEINKQQRKEDTQ